MATELNKRLCRLCKLEEMSFVHRKTAAYTILNCSTCKVPMLVLKEHKRECPQGILQAGVIDLAMIANRYHGPNSWYLDDSMRTIPEHYHIHARAGKV